MLKYLPVSEYFTVFLKNRNIIFKMKISKVTDYAALRAKTASECKLLPFEGSIMTEMIHIVFFNKTYN